MPTRVIYISNLPDEIIVIIAFYIRHPADLLSFALSSKRFHALIAQDELPFRCFNAPKDGNLNQSGFERLMENPQRARHIQMLDAEVVDRGILYVLGADGFDWRNNLEMTWSLVESEIPKMRNLEAIRQRRQVAWWNKGAVWLTKNQMLGNNVTMLSTYLTFGPGEEEDYNRYIDSHHTLPGGFEVPASFTNLTHFSLTSHRMSSVAVDFFIEHVLLPSLKPQMNLLALELALNYVDLRHDFSPIFQACTWPRLNHLSLGVLGGCRHNRGQPNIEHAIGFLSRHANTIETLMLPADSELCQPVFRHQFAKLRSVWFVPQHNQQASFEELIPSELGRNIKFLHPVRDKDLIKQLRKLPSTFPNLKGLSFDSRVEKGHLKLLLKTYPGLEALSFFCTGSEDEFPKRTMDRLVKLLSQFKNLTYLAGFLGFKDDKNTRYLASLATKSKSLKFVAMVVRWESHWVEILRGPDGSYVGHRPM